MTSTKLLRKSSLYPLGLCPSPRKPEQELKHGPEVTLEDKAYCLFSHITGPVVQEWYYIMGGAIPHLLLIRKIFSLFLYEANFFFFVCFHFFITGRNNKSQSEQESLFFGPILPGSFAQTLAVVMCIGPLDSLQVSKNCFSQARKKF